MTQPDEPPGGSASLLALATDLGVDLALHAAVLRMRDRLVAQAACPRSTTSTGHLKYPASRSPASSNSRITQSPSSLSKMDFEQVISMTKSMQLACVFLLAEVNPPPVRE